MKKLLLLALVLSCAWLPGAAQPAADDGVAVFAYSADQLAARFAGKTRKEVLYTINTVSSKDTTVQSSSGKEYALVRYGKNSDDFRIFLFDFKLPQKLVAVADDVKGVLAMNEKYGLNETLAEKDLSAQAPQTYLTTVTDVANNREYTAYQSGDTYLLFQNGVLKRTFTDSREFSAYMTTLAAANSSYAAQQAQQQAQLEQARLAAEQRRNQPKFVRSHSVVPTIVGTALLGGLVWGGIHYGRHHHHYRHHPGPRHHARPGHLPPLRPSGPPAGTPLLRGVDGRYMNR